MNSELPVAAWRASDKLQPIRAAKVFSSSALKNLFSLSALSLPEMGGGGEEGKGMRLAEPAKQTGGEGGRNSVADKN